MNIVIKKLKNNKSPGKALITGEILKATWDGEGLQKMHKLLCMARESEVSKRYGNREPLLHKLPKKGNLADVAIGGE